MANVIKYSTDREMLQQKKKKLKIKKVMSLIVLENFLEPNFFQEKYLDGLNQLRLAKMKNIEFNTWTIGHLIKNV